MLALIRWLLARLGFSRARVSREIPWRAVPRGSAEARAAEEEYLERKRRER
jgi:hypothetical protein